MRYTLRQLQVFIAIAHHQNLTRAADELAECRQQRVKRL